MYLYSLSAIRSTFGKGLKADFFAQTMSMPGAAEKTPVKCLIRPNWVISLMSSVFIFTFLSAITNDLGKAVNPFFEAFLFTAATSFCNLALLAVFPKYSDAADKLVNVKFYFSSYLGAFVIGTMTMLLYPALTGLQWRNGEFHFLPATISILTLNSLILTLQKIVILQRKKVRSEIENLQLKSNASETANLLLRQQIHPHFLFNSSSTIKSLYNEDHKQGEDTLLSGRVFPASFLGSI